MKIYQNSYTDGDFTHAGYEWFTSKAEANRVWVARHRSGSVIDGDHSIRAVTVTIDPKKAGIIRLLNDYASYPAAQLSAEAFLPGGEI